MLQIVVLAVLARLVAPASFGIVAAALVVMSLAGIFYQVGIGPALVQREAVEPRHLRVGFTMMLVLGILLGLAMWFAAPAAGAALRVPEVASVLRVVSAVFVVQAGAVVPAALLQRDLAFRTLATVDVVSYGVGYGVVGTASAAVGGGVWALVAAYLVQASVRTVLLARARPYPARPLVDLDAARDLLVFGTGFTIARVFNQVALQGDNLVVGRWLGAEALGVYGRAYQLMAMPAVLFGNALDSVLFPAMASVQNDANRLALVYRRGVGVVALVMLPASAGMVVVAPELVLVLLGPQWTDAVLPLRIFAVGMLLRTSYKLSDSLARAKGAVYRRAWRQAVYAAAVVIGAIVGQRWGVAGASLGVLAALAVNYVLMASLGLNLVSLDWRSWIVEHVRALPLALCTTAVAWGAATALRSAGLADLIVLGAAVASAAGVGAVAARLWPAAFLGTSGRWMVAVLAERLPRRIRPATPAVASVEGDEGVA